MSYIEDIQKINKLAKEMLIHGMATSLDEAVSKAQNTLRDSGSITIDFSHMKQKVMEQKENKKEISEEESIKSTPDSVLAQGPEQRITWQEAMTKNTQYVVGQFKSYQELFENIGKEIMLLKREIQGLKNNQSSFRVPEINKEQVINIEDRPVTPTIQRQSYAEEKKPESHPRQGSYTPGDVSIEKFFYYGNK
ncbi:hypothetical protein J4418_03740 [Candidatus Woesearchaeota archaeon]|nr:hypothetical protein [Candidatus Woesearchaeota archaeon]